MRTSPSLAAYLAYSRRTQTRPLPPETPRPAGELVWIHITNPVQAPALVQLAERLTQQRPDTSVLLTVAGEALLKKIRTQSMIIAASPSDTVAAAEVFLSHWSPDICIWSGGNLQPALLTYTHRAGIPLFLVNAEESQLSPASWRWFPDLPRALLQSFQRTFTQDEATARYLRRLGVSKERVNVTGPLQENAVTLPFNVSDREELSNILRGRPIWLAAMLDLQECFTILEAHREISHLSHRAMLIIVPDDPDQGTAFQEVLRQQDLRHIIWSEGELPDESTQVLLADTHGEMGLWYRLSPIAFMGCSLVAQLGGRDPNEPAAHGSAILHGPHISHYISSYARFADAGAARSVGDVSTLASALRKVIPVDQSAIMAHAAWDVASRGAEVTDLILSLIQDELDQRAAR